MLFAVFVCDSDELTKICICNVHTSF